MVLSKKGLSGVITTVLIILLVIIAVGIIWAAVRAPIEETTDQIGAECLTIDLEVTGCSTSLGEITVRRNDGTEGLTDIKFILNDGASVVDGSSVTGTLPGSLESSTYSGFTAPGNVEVVGVVTLSSGSEKVCTPTGAVFTCAS